MTPDGGAYTLTVKCQMLLNLKKNFSSEDRGSSFTQPHRTPVKLLMVMAFVLSFSGCTPVTTTPTSVPVPVTSETAKPTSTAGPSKPIALPPQGLYDSCVPGVADCNDHLDTLASKGFTLILNYGQMYGTTDAQIAYADRAQSLGMKIIWCTRWPIRRFRPPSRR